MRPGERFEARVVRSRRLTPTTHGIDVEKPAGFTFQPTQFTFLQLETPDEAEPFAGAGGATHGSAPLQEIPQETLRPLGEAVVTATRVTSTKLRVRIFPRAS